MANRQIYQLTTQTLGLDSYIPIQDANGVTEAKITFVRSIANLITGSIIGASEPSVLGFFPSRFGNNRPGAIYSLNPLANVTAGRTYVDSVIALGSGSFTGLTDYLPPSTPPAFSFAIGELAGANSQRTGEITVFGRKSMYNTFYTLSSIAFGRGAAMNSYQCTISQFFGFYAGSGITTRRGISPSTNNVTVSSYGVPQSSIFGYSAAYSASTDGYRYIANDNDSPTRNELYAFGQAAGFKNFGSCLPVFMGPGAGAFSHRSFGSVFIGSKTGQADSSLSEDLSTARYATFLGTNTGTGTYNGDHNILIGFNVESGSGELPIGNIVIGKNIKAPALGDGTMNLGGVIYARGMSVNYYTSNLAGLQTPVPPQNNPRVGIAQHNPQYMLDISGSLQVKSNRINFRNLPRYTSDTAAAAANLPIGYLYRNGNVVSIRVN